jgi:hypothetical protein
MTRAQSHFREGDVRKLIRAAKAAGSKIEAIEIAPDGRVIITVTDADGKEAVTTVKQNPWDNW